MNFYVKQHEDYGIGNFINCTPTLISLAKHFNFPIPVVFADKFVSEMFYKCNFIKIISQEEVKGLPRLFDSSLINLSIEDWKYIYQKVVESGIQLDAAIPHTYVDRYDIPDKYKNMKYAVIVRGIKYSPESDWIGMKDPGDEIYKYIMQDLVKRGFELVFIGTDLDYERDLKRMREWVKNVHIELNDMTKSLGVLEGSSVIIANDTGMYHAAGALNKEVFVMWKDTPFLKNKSPGVNCSFSMKGNWKTDYDKWIVK